jgi:hypothetical protein
LSETLLYDLDFFTVFSTDASMSVSSASHTMTEGTDAHSSVSWIIENLKKGETLNIKFSGGKASPTGTGGGTRPVISLRPNSTRSLSILMMIILGLALLAFIAVASRERRGSGVETRQLEDFRMRLVRRLARLDDVHESGAVPGAAYHAKRQELKNQIASIVLQIRKSQGRQKHDRSNHPNSGSEKKARK